MLTIITGKEGSILTSDHSWHSLHCINLLLKKAIEKLRGYVQLKFTIFSNNHEGGFNTINFKIDINEVI